MSDETPVSAAPPTITELTPEQAAGVLNVLVGQIMRQNDAITAMGEHVTKQSNVFARYTEHLVRLTQILERIEGRLGTLVQRQAMN